MIVDRFHPVTHDFGLVHAPLEEVVRAYLEWQRHLHKYSRREIPEGLAAALEALAPFSAAMNRRLFVATASEWTAFCQNGILGSDPFGPMGVLSQRMAVTAMRVCSTVKGAKWPAVMWDVYSLEGPPPLHVRRSLCAMNDGGRWAFHSVGEPYPFEHAYDQPRKRDRFTQAILLEYLAHFGVRPFDDDFFVVGGERPAILLERARVPNDAPEFSLDALIAGAPWRR
jgi:hypothetical protein